MVTYMLAILLLVNPYLFGVNSIAESFSQLLLLRTIISTFFIPAFAAIMMKFLGMIQSMEMREREERYIPYIITGVFYCWLTVNFLNNSDIPAAFSIFMLGATIGLFIAFFINIFSKISAHAVGVGGLMAMVLITLFQYSYGAIVVPYFNGAVLEIGNFWLLGATILIVGMVGTARLILKAHEINDVLGGFMVGMLAQFIAFRVVTLFLNH